MEHGLTTEYKKVLNAFKNNKDDEALTLMKNIGDIHFINKIESYICSKLQVEKLTLIDQLMEAVLDERLRFPEGKIEMKKDIKINSVLELFDILKNDDKCYFYPLLGEDEYNKLSDYKIEEGYSIPAIDYTSKFKFSNIKWHNNHLNLSILGKIEVDVVIPERMEIGGIVHIKPRSLSSKIESFQWKNYLLIFDGKLYTDKIMIETSNEVAEILRVNNILDPNDTIREENLYYIDLTNLPIVNTNTLKDEIYMKELFEDYIEEMYLKAKEKVLKNLKLDSEGKYFLPGEKQSKYSISEMNYLLKCGFREDGSYSPPIIKLDNQKKLNVVSFDIKINDLTTIPSLKEVFTNTSKEKSLGIKILDIHFKTIMGELSKPNITNPEQYKIICRQLNEVQSSLKTLREKIQKQKFNVVLGNLWFKDLPQDDKKEHSVSVNDVRTLNSIVSGKVKIHRVDISV